VAISLVSSSEAPRWIFNLAARAANTTIDQLFAVCTGMERIFYASLYTSSPNRPKWVKQIQVVAKENIHNIQNGFFFLNLGASVLCAWDLLLKIEKQFSIVIVSRSRTLDEKMVWPVLLTLTTLLASAALLWNKWSMPPQTVPRADEMEMSERFDVLQQGAQLLHLARLAMYVALAYLSRDRFWPIVNAIGSALNLYNLLSNPQRVLFSKVCEEGLGLLRQDGITSVKFTYETRASSHGDFSAESDECPICFDPKPDVFFCTNHRFCRECLKNYLGSKVAELIGASQYTLTVMQHYVDGSPTHTTHEYAIDVPETALPSCPLCRDHPKQNTCELTVSEAGYGQCRTFTNIVREDSGQSPLFEKLHAAYSVAQAGLAFLQRYPELAVVTFKIQRALIISDVVFLVFTVRHLYEKFKKKIARSARVVFATGLSVIPLAILLYKIKKLKYGLPSQETLLGLQSSLQLAQGIKVIGWDSPLIHRLMQAVYIHRAAASIAMAYYSEKPGVSLLAAGAQIFSLSMLAQMKWLSLEQILEWPLGKIVAAGGTLDRYLSEQHLKRLAVRTSVLVHPTDFHKPMRLQSAVTWACDYMNRLFDHSFWERYWKIYSVKGIEVARDLNYSVVLGDAALQTYTDAHCPFLVNAAMAATDVARTGATRHVEVLLSNLPWSVNVKWLPDSWFAFLANLVKR
jgi:hypothetical protein